MARKTDSQRWLIAELSIQVPALTPQGRDALVKFLQETSQKILAFKCQDNHDWNQPERKYRLKVGY